MCSMMILQNRSIKDVMFVDEVSECTIFHNICLLGHFKLLLFLESMMSTKEFTDYVFHCNNTNNQKPIEHVVGFSHSLLVKHLFDKKEVQERYKNSDPLMFRLIIQLFG